MSVFFGASLPPCPPEGCFWSRAHVFKELVFVGRSLPRLERRTFSSLELASQRLHRNRSGEESMYFDAQE